MRSTMMARSAPNSSALRAAIKPTPPAPQTATVSPPAMSQKSAPMKPVGTASDKNSACSSAMSPGITKQFASANGTRTYWAWDPA